MQRQLFICSAVETCQEQSNCCAHKQPHIKDERCIPKLCRYGPRDVEVDCVLADPVNPHVPKAKPVAEPVKPVPSPIPTSGTGTSPEGATVEEPVKKPEEVTQTYVPGPVTERTKELIEKETPVPKKPEPAQRPVTLRNKPRRKAAK